MSYELLACVIWGAISGILFLWLLDVSSRLKNIRALNHDKHSRILELQREVESLQYDVGAARKKAQIAKEQKDRVIEAEAKMRSRLAELQSERESDREEYDSLAYSVCQRAGVLRRKLGRFHSAYSQRLQEFDKEFFEQNPGKMGEYGYTELGNWTKQLNGWVNSLLQASYDLRRKTDKLSKPQPLSEMVEKELGFPEVSLKHVSDSDVWEVVREEDMKKLESSGVPE